MGVCSSAQIRPCRELNEDERNCATIIAQVCNLTYLDSNKDVDFFKEEAAKIELILEEELNLSKTDLVINDIKLWKNEVNFAVTCKVKVNCKPLDLSPTSEPIEMNVVAFRGTTSFYEVAQDFEGSLFLDTFVSTKGATIGQAGKGFIEAYIGLRDLNIIDYLVKDKKAQKVVVTGHSLGGAMANLMAAELVTDYPSLRVGVVTMGAPRVFDKQLADFMTKHPTKLLRFVNHGDPIPQLPLSILGFSHTGEAAYYVHGGEDESDKWMLLPKGHLDYGGERDWSSLFNAPFHSMAGVAGYFTRLTPDVVAQSD